MNKINIFIKNLLFLLFVNSCNVYNEDILELKSEIKNLEKIIKSIRQEKNVRIKELEDLNKELTDKISQKIKASKIIRDGEQKNVVPEEDE